MEKLPMTREGFEKLQAELKQLKTPHKEGLKSSILKIFYAYNFVFNFTLRSDNFCFITFIFA